MKPTLRYFALTAVLLAPPALGQSLNVGDLWIASKWMKTPTGYGPGVSRIDVSTATGHLMCEFPAGNDLYTATFDPYRNGIVTSTVLLSPVGSSFQFVLVKADGSLVPLGVTSTSAKCLAATGDGRIYFSTPFVSPQALRYIDAGNAVHDVLDATGTAPFEPTTSLSVRATIYDASTNSIFMGFIGSSACPTGASTASILKIPLSADGTKSGGPVVSAPVCVSGIASGTQITNLSQGPGGQLMAVIHDNTNNPVGRMVLIDKQTLAATTYATNGPYTGSAVNVAGVYSHVLDSAVIDDGFNEVLRVFSQGSSGSGSVWCTGEGIALFADSTMMEITSTLSNGLVPYGSGTWGCQGPHGLFASAPPAVGTADFRFTGTHAPAGGLGLLIVGDVADIAGSDPFGLGTKLHVNVFASTFLTSLDMTAGPSGFASSPAPIPILPSFVGATVDAQVLWYWSGGCPGLPIGLASSTGLAVTFLP